MNLELGIAGSHGPGNCQVELLATGAVVEARHSAKMLNKVRVRSQQLVVVDRAKEPPEVVYRAAHRGTVQSLTGDRVSVVALDEDGSPRQDADGNEVQHVQTAGLEATLAPGSEVFFTGGPEGSVVDIVIEGKPAHPDQVRLAVFPKVMAIYEE